MNICFNYKKIFLFSLVFVRNCHSYILPQTFREWTPIGINNQIDKTKPYFFNLGNMPILLWHNKKEVPSVMINTCKHLGNSLSGSYIENNCLVCPHHKNTYNENDNLGTAVLNEQDGLIWWSYKSYTKKPFQFTAIRYDDYYNTYVDIDMDVISCVLNLIADFKYELFKKSKSGTKILLKDEKTNNKLLFVYPYTILVHNDNYYYKYSISPIGVHKSRIFITSNDKKNKDLNLEKKINTFPFKFRYAFNNGNNKKEEEQIFNLYKNKYMILDDITISHFLTNMKYY